MALIQTHFFSEALTECSSMNVIIPVEAYPRELYPVLWLLPPIGCDHTAWQRNTGVEQLAEKYRIIAVMPDMKLSYGLDMAYGLDYFKMLTKELPEMAAHYFPVDMGFQMIAGAKEGAYGAVMAALRFPGRYRAAAALSAGSLTDENWEETMESQAEHAFGTRNTAVLRGGDYDLGYWLENLTDERLQVFLAYSPHDQLGLSAGILKEKLKKKIGGRLWAKEWQEPLTWAHWLAGVEHMVKAAVSAPL